MLSRSPHISPLGTSEGNNGTLLELPAGAITRFGRGMVADLEFSANSKFLAVASRTGLWWYSLASMSTTALWETERGVVSTVSCSSDGRWFAIGTADGILKLWDMRNQVCVAQLDRQSGVYTSVRHTFSLDGQHLAVFGALPTNMIYLIDPETGNVRAILGDEKTIKLRRPAGKPIAFSVDGKFLAHVSPSEDMSSEFVCVWDVETGVCLTSLTEHLDYVYGLCFSPCGHFLCIGCWNGRLIVWDIFKNRLVLKRIQHEKYRMYPYYLPTGQLIAAGLYQRYTHKPVDIWSVKNDEKLDEIDINGYPICARFSKDGTQLAIATHDQIKVWSLPKKDTQNEAESGVVEVSRKKGNEANFSRSATFSRQQTIENLTIRTRPTISGHTGVVNSIVFSQDGRKLVAGYDSDNLLLWDIGSQSSQRPYNAHPIFQKYIVQTSPSGKIFSVGVNSNPDVIQVWDVIKGRSPIAEFTYPPKIVYRPAVALAPEANLLVVGNMSGQLDVWDVQCRHKRYTLIGHKTQVGSIEFSSDGKRIVSSCRIYETVRLWDIETGA
ncbi:WD40 repeat domain-containing protein [Candidatus Poribacteria bacterium]|nr:WD40 repeat domain-containing protein [Candidatus Poribacteria bacterium]